MKPLSLLYPSHCMLCRKAIAADQQGLCSSCRSMVKAEMCSLVCQPPQGVERLVCSMRYTGKFAGAITAYKFKQQRAYAAPLAQLMMQAWEWNGMKKPDIITYVPISTLRMHTRGFNQSRDLAQIIADTWQVPIQATLRRRLLSRRQSNLHARQRWNNAQKTFLLRSDTNLTGKTVLLIDDIVTTGATVSSCAALLKKSGAHTVWVLAAAKTS